MGYTLYVGRAWDRLDRDVEKLKSWIIKKKLEDQSVKSICVQAKISRKMFYCWVEPLPNPRLERSKRKSQRSPVWSSAWGTQKEKIIKLRKRYEWGPNKIAGYLSHRDIDVDHHQVYAVICPAGLNHPITATRKTWETNVLSVNTTTASGGRILSSATLFQSDVVRGCACDFSDYSGFGYYWISY